MRFLSRFSTALCIPRSLVLCLRVFGRGGMHIPVLFSNRVHVRGLRRGSMRIAQPSRFGVRIGFGGSLGISCNRTSVIVADGGVIDFGGRATLCEGTMMRVEGGHLSFGSDFNSNKNCRFWCNHEMSFGNDCLLGWDVSLRDADGHTVFGPDGEPGNAPVGVHVGDHVWIAADVDVFKGARIPDGSVVAARALVTKQFNEPNVLLGGLPAKVIRHGVSWQL